MFEASSFDIFLTTDDSVTEFSSFGASLTAIGLLTPPMAEITMNKLIAVKFKISYV